MGSLHPPDHHRESGYPSAGCTPAEPASVSTGQKNIITRVRAGNNNPFRFHIVNHCYMRIQFRIYPPGVEKTIGSVTGNSSRKKTVIDLAGSYCP